MSRHCVASLATALLILFSVARQVSATDTPVDFNRDVRPIFARHCIACHGGVKRTKGLSFLFPETVLPPGDAVVVPGDPDASELYRRICSDDPGYRMPPPEKHDQLTVEEIETIRRWIEQGARWEPHWAYVVPQRPSLPTISNRNWPRSAMDVFVLAELEARGLAPSPEATPLEVARRACFDLIGLPPNEATLRGFLTDRRPDAYERLVDRLLASPHFGERWTSMWLDLARYADSQGYEKDNLRTMWPYRDWVIDAFNGDMPFDAFTVRQLAGDLLPGATLEDLIATAFHRNTPTNAEGGTDDEEFRVVAVIDRVNTTWEVWQGFTFKCIQCHNHPYNPIDHREYYNFLAYFNTSRDWDLREDLPKLRVPAERSQFPRAMELFRQREALELEEVSQTRALTAQTEWTYLRPVHAVSTGLTELVVKLDENGIPEIHATGTVSHNSRFTLEFALPENRSRITALLLEAVPLNPERAIHSPELGFVISELKAELLTRKQEESGDGQWAAEPIKLRWALGDETLPFGDAQASLNPDKAGWGAKPRMTHTRHLVVVPEKPIEYAKGSHLRLVIRQEDAPNDLAPLVMHRSRYAVTDSEAWTEYVTSSTFVERRQQLDQIKREQRSMKGVDLPIMLEQDPWLRRATAVFRRGNWQDKTELVQPGLPAMFHVAEQPTNRLEMASWLVSDENPLTARVTVNRFWQELFGTGIVETSGDFTLSGTPPTNQPLLDYLAVRFQKDFGWSMKRLLREIVTSATYRQSAKAPDALVAMDPQNRLLARGPRLRLTAEMIRDNALAVAGLLTYQLHGPPVMPPQPEGIWRAARSSLRWKTDTGPKRYRRGVYVIWRRSSPYPSFMTFDAPQRLVCSSRRVITNTPLQALVTLNDEAFVECAVGLADRMMHMEGDPAHKVAYGYRCATGRNPDSETLRILMDVYRTALEEYRQHPDLANALAGSPERSAFALVANTILNLDEVLNR